MAEQSVPPVAPEVSSDDRLWALLCFLLAPLVPLIAILMEDKKNRPFIKHHAVPALILGIVESILVGVLSLIPVVGCFTPIIWIINILFAIKANKGEYVDVPVITGFAKSQGWI